MKSSEPKVRPIRKLFIANRGEIARRICQTAHRMGIETIGLVSDNDPYSAATIQVSTNGKTAADLFLNPQWLVKTALKHGADAIHPGYGYLSENGEFARMVLEAGLIFVGPALSAIHAMGNKNNARKIAAQLNIPVTKALNGSIANILEKSDLLSFPLLVKAAAGGGGKGMLPVFNRDELEDSLLQTSREALSYFGDSTVFVEQYIENPRHIEVQILGDQYGNLIHLFERECSIQRRYQKIVEEAPSPFVDTQLRERLTRDALKIAQAINYHNAGTIEFLVDENGHHYFLEMNTRIQVEHPVTEAITGIDLVEQQLLMAMGFPLSINQDQLQINGHAIECRIYAEDATHNFRPAPGWVHWVSWPATAVARTYTWFDEPVEISPLFDPMVAKITTHAKSRNQAILKAQRALDATHLTGLTTNIAYLKSILTDELFHKTQTHTGYCRHHNFHAPVLPATEVLAAAYLIWLLNDKPKGDTIWHRMGYWRLNHEAALAINGVDYRIFYNHTRDGSLEIVINQSTIQVFNPNFSTHELSFSSETNRYQFTWAKTRDGKLILEFNHQPIEVIPKFRIDNKPVSDYDPSKTKSDQFRILAPIPGKVTALLAKEGMAVKKGDRLITLEAMKMENHLLADEDGLIDTIYAKPGQQVKAREMLVTLIRAGE